MQYRFGLKILSEVAHHASAECDLPSGQTVEAEATSFVNGEVILTNPEYLAHKDDQIPFRVTLFDAQNVPLSVTSGTAVIPGVCIVTLEEVAEVTPPQTPPPEGGG